MATAAEVKQLRDMTGAGMMDCKKALDATNGNMDEAVEFLRKKGLAASQKKAGRIAAEGACVAFEAADGKRAAIVEINSETDFVARNEKFLDYANAVAKQAAESDAADLDAFFKETWALDPQFTVEQQLSQMISIIGENMHIRRFERYTTETGYVHTYIHTAGRVGVIVELETSVINDQVKECAHAVALQIAALKPKYLDENSIPEDYKKHEEEIAREQINNDPKMANKPANILDNIIKGKLKAEFKEICLVDQPFVKDDKQSVGQYVQSVAKAVGSPIAIKRFERYETGEGLEKKSENFAEEVAKQMGAQ
jgi:elongation factor Ts